MPANTVKVRDANTAGASSNKAVVDEQILIGDGTGFTSAALSQDVLMTNAGVVTIQPDVVTNAKLNNMAANTVKVNATADAENPTDLALDSNTLLARVGTGNIAGLSVPASTVVGRIASGDIIAAQIATTQIANDAITEIKIADDQVAYAKIQNVAVANRVLGSRTAGGPVVETLVYKEMIAAGAAVPDQTDPGTVDMVLYSDGENAGWTKVAEANLADAVTLIIYNSAGTAVKTLYGAGS